MPRRAVSNLELREMISRAHRVLDNNNASGSARALAGDILTFAVPLLAQRMKRSKTERAVAERERQHEILRQLDWEV